MAAYLNQYNMTQDHLVEMLDLMGNLDERLGTKNMWPITQLTIGLIFSSIAWAAVDLTQTQEAN